MRTHLTILSPCTAPHHRAANVVGQYSPPAPGHPAASPKPSAAKHILQKTAGWLAPNILFAALCCLLAVTAASAQTKSWTGAINTNWATDGNWNPSGAPAADDDVVIADVDNDPTIPANTAALAKSVVVNTGGVFAIAVTGSLTTDGSTDFEGRRFKDQMQKPSVSRSAFFFTL